MLLYFLKPVNSVDKGLVSSDIISQENTVSSSVENTSYTLERLLASGVPDLKLNNFILDRASERTKLYSDGDLMFSLELIVLDSAHQTTLTDTSISNDDQFKEVVLSSKRFILDDVKRHTLEVTNLILVHFI